VNIIILDDYPDAVRKLRCTSKLESLNAKVFTNTVKGIGQLSTSPPACQCRASRRAAVMTTGLPGASTQCRNQAARALRFAAGGISRPGRHAWASHRSIPK
jgi:hypothetical protein